MTLPVAFVEGSEGGFGVCSMKRRSNEDDESVQVS